MPGKESQRKNKRRLLESFFAREEPDENYLPELKFQWKLMSRTEQIKFIMGAIVGLILILGGLILAFIILNAMRS